MYTLLVTNENTVITTIKERIVQRSKLCDNFHILVPADYKGIDMQEFEVTMMYELPVSKEKYSTTLKKEPELYKRDYIEYKIPADTWITKEAGIINFALTFTKVVMGDDSNVKQYVRKVTDGTIEISACEDWASAIADPLLQTVDQRIIQLQMLAKQMDEASQYMYENQVDDLSLEKDHLRVSVKGEPIGEGVHILVPEIDDGEIDGVGDGIIDLDNANIQGNPTDPDDDNSFIEL